MTLDEFLDWEQRQPIRYEFDGLGAVAMTGGTLAHSEIQGNLALALKSRLRGKPCRFVGNDVKIEVAGRIRYPDGYVTCTPHGPGDTIIRDPVVIFEGLSQSTAAIDTIVKNREYAATPSILRYVILAQDVVGGTMFERTSEDWVGHVLGPEGILRMPEIGVEVPVSEFYEGIDLPPLPAEDRVDG
jgi:Uma2 family endonuclease